MSEWSDAVKVFQAAAQTLNSAAAALHGAAGGGLSGQQQLGALTNVLGPTSQGAKQATSDLDAANRSAQGFLANFSEARVRQLGLNTLHQGLGLVADEAKHVIDTVSGFERWEQSIGRLDADSTTLTGMANDFSDLRKEIELLAFGPAIQELEARLNTDVTPSGKSTLEQAANGIGGALSGAVDRLFDLNAGIADVQRKIREALGTDTHPLFDLGIPDDAVSNQFTDYINSTKQAQQEVQTLTSYLTRLDAEAGDLRANYEAAVKPLRDQLDLINKTYDAQQRQKALTDAERNVTREQALAVDVFSAAGQAANAALPDDLQRLQDLRDAQAHQAQVDALNTQIDAATDHYNAQRDDLNKRQSGAQRDLSNARLGISSEAAQAQLEAQRAAWIGASHMNDPHDTTPLTYWQTTGLPGAPGPGSTFRDTTSNGVTQTLGQVVIVLPSGTANKAWFKAMMDEPDVKTKMGQTAAGQ